MDFSKSHSPQSTVAFRKATAHSYFSKIHSSTKQGLRPLRYKLVMMEVMRNMIMKIKMKVIVMMMNQLRMNYLTC